MTTTTTTKMKIGPRMKDVALLARERTTIIDVAREVGPNGSLRYGYATVERAIRAGLVVVMPPLPGRRGKSIVAL